MKKKLFSLFSIFIAVLMIFGMVNLPKNAVAQAPDPHLEKVENKVLDALSTEGTSDYVIEMAEKADLSKAYSITDWSERGWFVYDTLREVAERTQKPIIEILKKQGIKYQSFFAANEIAVYGSGLSTLTEISSLKAVDHIRFPRTATIDPGFLSIQPSTVLQSSINALDWGITDTNADDFWSAYGLQGDGLIVANIDTGVQWDHPALDQSFKCGTNPADPACWADPANVCGGSACDNNGHGTHTMGTMVGDDDPNLTYQVGMAPNAQWIACKGCEDNSCSDTSLNACADWILAPGGDPANRPHIVNNSWGGGGGDAWYMAKVNSWRASGIFPAFSAGNSGPACGSIGSPGDYQESFATANHQVSRLINSGSSRGPSVYGDAPYTKPNLSAPGTNICSSVPGSAWNCGYTGTSMAAPHVAGAVALLWSCNPSYIGNMTATFELLQDTADPPLDAGDCGAPTDGEGNFTYGYGYLNVLAAGQQVCAAGTIAGTVTDGTTAIEGATITADNGAGLIMDTLTLADGTYTLNVPGGIYTVSATKYGYSQDVEPGVYVFEGETTYVNLIMFQWGTSLVSGYVYDGGVVGVGAHGYPLYSSIRVSTPGFDETIYTDPFTGYYEIELLDSQPYSFDVQAVPPGYSMLSESVTPTGATYSKDFALIVGPSCSAPGYQKSLNVTLSEGFESGALPAGWVNYDYIGNGQVWQFNDPRGRGNLTPGGEGGFAILDSDNYGSEYSQDAGLRTPVMDFTGKAGVVLDFDTDFNYWSSADSAIVWVSNDSGANWEPVWTKTTDFNGHVTLDISAQAANQADVIVEFNYVGSWGYWWQVDDVVISSIDCNLAEGGVVAGYVLDDNDDSPIVGADVYSDVVATQTFFIPEDPASEGLYWVFHPVMGPVKGVQSLYGSNVVFDPTAGGASGYEPGVPTTLCFESNIYTGDWEYLYDTWLKFPMDWTISSAYLVGTPTCDSGSWGSFSVYWETEPYEIDIYHSASTEEVDHCVAEYCVDVTPSASAGLVSWYFDGDGYGSGPHHPCSSDSYTPGSMASQPCDQWENPQASIPAIGGEAHDFTAEKALYGSDTQTVTVFEDFIVQQDFYLGTGNLAFEPLSMEATMFMGDTPLTQTLTISNLGTSDAMFELVEKDEGFVLPKLMIPAFKGELPEDTRPTSIGLAPDAGKDKALSASVENPFKGILAGEPAFAIDAYPGENLVNIPDTTLPGTWNIVGSLAGTSYFAGDFVGGDFTTLYVISNDNNNLYAIDTATAVQTLIGTTTPPAGQTFSGLTGTPDGTMYGLVTDCSASSLVTVDIATGATVNLGDLPGVGCGIDLAYDTDDDMIYIVELLTSNLFRVDPATVTVTEVGSLGVSPNYAQGMDYEEDSGVLYWAAYTSSGELRIIDTTTGASTLVGAFPGGAEVDCLAFATGGQSDVPWLSEDPISGTVPALGSIDVTVTYDPTGAGLTQPGNYLAELKVKHDTPYIYPNIPVVLHLIAPEDYGTFNGHVMGLEACDVNPAALEGATVNFWQGGMIMYTTTTNAEGYFSYAVPEGPYDIEVMADGFISQIVFDQDIMGGDTVTVDFTLRLEAPCISVDPTSLEQTQATDTITTQTLTIINTGAGDGVFELFEMEATGLHADVELVVDDGVAEDSIGVTDSVSSYQFIWMNRFTPNIADFPFNLAEISILWPSGQVATGSSVELVVYQDKDADGDPTNAELVGNYTVTVQNVDGVTWDIYFLADSPLLDGPGDVLIGAINRWVTSAVTPAQWPANIDMTASQGRSWLGWWNADPPVPPVLPPDNTFGQIDALGFAGNWMVRGVGSSATADIVWLSLDPTAGVVLPDSSTDVTVTYDSTGLAEGDYFAAIRVKNPPAAAINVPVTLHVTNWNYLYLPLILK